MVTVVRSQGRTAPQAEIVLSKGARDLIIAAVSPLCVIKASQNLRYVRPLALRPQLGGDGHESDSPLHQVHNYIAYIIGWTVEKKGKRLIQLFLTFNLTPCACIHGHGQLQS